MITKNALAVKHDEELAKLESELVAQAEPKEETQIEQEVETTTKEEPAPSENKPTEEVKPEAEKPASEPVEEELSEDEEARLGDKTRNQMSKLREKARKADELEKELEVLRQKDSARKPLDDIEQVYQTEEPERPGLPWDQQSITPIDVKKLAREEVIREKKLTQISVDADYLEGNVPELNPESSDYNSKLAQDVYSTFRLRFLSDDTTRLKDVAQEKLDLIKDVEAKFKKRSEEVKTIEKQAAEQALPISVTPPQPKTSMIDNIKKATSWKELEALEKSIGKSR